MAATAAAAAASAVGGGGMSTHQCGHLKLILISKCRNRKRLVEHGRRKWEREKKESCSKSFISVAHNSPLVTFSAAAVALFSHYLSAV